MFILQLYQTEMSWGLRESESVTEERYLGRHIGGESKVKEEKEKEAEEDKIQSYLKQTSAVLL